jgi:hypothetical protein
MTDSRNGTPPGPKGDRESEQHRDGPGDEPFPGRDRDHRLRHRIALERPEHPPQEDVLFGASDIAPSLMATEGMGSVLYRAARLFEVPAEETAMVVGQLAAGHE